MTVSKQNYINHIGIAIDASGSMADHAATVVKVVDNLVADLGRQSKTFEQATRISVWSFWTTETRTGLGYSSKLVRTNHIPCLIWDMDVLRVPSIAGKYEATGGTPLVDAGILAIEDLKLVTEKYGDHGFLLYLVTDGDENTSANSAKTLSDLINAAPDNWTIAALVPDVRSKGFMQALGVPAGNVSIWDTQSRTGFEELGAAVAAANTGYMTMRATGAKSSTNLFGGAATVNAATVAAAKLKPVDPKTYEMWKVIPTDAVKNERGQIEIATYVRSVNNGMYAMGKVYYPVVQGIHRNPRIDPQKEIAIWDKDDRMLYSGPGVREMLGIPKDKAVTVKPDMNPKYIVYVQSTSPNRYLTPHSEILVLK